MTMIEIQVAFIDRLLEAHAKIGPRSAGLRFAKTVRAARKELIARLMKMGWSREAAIVVGRDAYDMFILERDACDTLE